MKTVATEETRLSHRAETDGPSKYQERNVIFFSDSEMIPEAANSRAGGHLRPSVILLSFSLSPNFILMMCSDFYLY
jgi:hypothetical protein